MGRGRGAGVVCVLALAACGGGGEPGEPPDAGLPPDAGSDSGVCEPAPHVDDPPYEPPPCPDGPAGDAADRLEDALEIAGLSRASFGWSEADWGHAPYLEALFRFALPDFRSSHDAPATAPCLAADVTGRIDQAQGSTHPLSLLVAEEAARLGHPVDEAELDWDTPCDGAPLAAPLSALVASLGGSQTEDEVRAALSAVPTDLQTELAPVVLALAAAADARAGVRATLGEPWSREIFEALPSLAFPAFVGFNWTDFDYGDAGLVGALDGPWLGDLYQAAYDLAVALDHARPRLRALAGSRGFDVDLDTPGGRILLCDGAAQTRAWAGSDATPVALLVDTGGDDTYRVPAGGVVSLDQPVALAIDLGGSDVWAYEESPDPDADAGHRIPMDSGGRYPGDLYFGPFSLSTTSRQGAARLGIGIVEDLGGGDDVYRSLRMSQGFGLAGVGILHDDGGDDSYTAESASQGAALFGIGLLLDDAGRDEYVSYEESQGIGLAKGAGALADGGGDDGYVCDSGIPEEGGDPLYYALLRPGLANTSLCQGMGLGLRGDAPYWDPPTYWSGGLGVLHDRDGDDTYVASVFAQGSGYWSGIGILSDGGGEDTYDAVGFSQGGAVHYSTAILVDSGGNDVYDGNEWVVDMSLGTGRDYSLGVLVDESGDDRYFARFHCAAMGLCNGIGLLVDGAGSDVYRSTARGTWGGANLLDECLDRQDAITAGVFLDVGGDDTYERDAGAVVLGDDTSWTQEGQGVPSEHGVGLDAPDGDPSIHAP